MHPTRRSALFGAALALSPLSRALAAAATEVVFSRLKPDQITTLEEYRSNLRDLHTQMVRAGMITDRTSPVEFGQAILDKQIVSAQSASDGETIGVLLGDAIVARGGFQWLSVTDAAGQRPVVCHARKQTFIAPITAVLTRFQQGEADFNLAAFMDGLVQACLARAASKDVGDLPAALRLQASTTP